MMGEGWEGSFYMLRNLPNSMQFRIYEHKKNCRLGPTKKSSMPEHALTDEDHLILVDKTVSNQFQQEGGTSMETELSIYAPVPNKNSS